MTFQQKYDGLTRIAQRYEQQAETQPNMTLQEIFDAQVRASQIYANRAMLMLDAVDAVQFEGDLK